MLSEERRHTDEESTKLFKQLFGDVDKLMHRLAPDGWENSPYFYVFHPTPQQRYEEALRFHENLKRLPFGKNESADDKPPALEEFLNEKDDKPVEPGKELVELFGHCLWDIFSDNHTVLSSDGCEYDIGSFRGAGGFIAEFINTHLPQEGLRPRRGERYDYLDFYMGSIWVRGRAGLLPVYELIFKRLQEAQCDWTYSFPRLYAISPNEIKESLGLEDEENPAEYNPNKALQEEAEREEKKKELEEFRAELQKSYEEDVESAKHQPLPEPVQAYKNVFGKLPQGWPHR